MLFFKIIQDIWINLYTPTAKALEFMLKLISRSLNEFQYGIQYLLRNKYKKESTSQARYLVRNKSLSTLLELCFTYKKSKNA